MSEANTQGVISTPKLTARQKEVLDALCAGATAVYMPYMGSYRPNAYWFLTNAPSFPRHRVTREMERLLALGLAKYTKRDFRGSHAEAV